MQCFKIRRKHLQKIFKTTCICWITNKILYKYVTWRYSIDSVCFLVLQRRIWLHTTPLRVLLGFRASKFFAVWLGLRWFGRCLRLNYPIVPNSIYCFHFYLHFIVLKSNFCYKLELKLKKQRYISLNFHIH